MRCLGGLIILLLLSLAPPSPSLAFSTPDVDLRDPAYRDLDRLVAAGLVETVIFGQRPYSRLEMARLLLQAEDSFERRRGQGSLREPLAATLERILARMRRQFAPEARFLSEGEEPPPLALRPLSEARLDYEYTNSPPAHFTANNGLGILDGARIQPFADFRQGQPLARGSQLTLETVSTLRAGRHLSLLAEPRFYLPWRSEVASQATLLQLYGRLAAGNATLSAGRKSLLWGQGELAGLLLSGNALPLDLVTLTNDEPRLLPSLLRFLGPTKGTFLYADLGDTYRHPGAYLVGLKVSLEPHPNFELGISNLLISGGRGAPEASLGERIEDVFSFNTEKPISNRIGGFEARLRLPSLRGATLYIELMFDDPNANLGVLFGDEAAYLFGVYLPLADAAGRLSLRAEYRRLGVRFYRHSQFPAVRKGDILGDPLGPDAQAGYLTADYDLTEALRVRLELAVELRGSDTYQVTDPEEMTKVVVREGPTERRYRLLAGLCYGLRAGLCLEGALGYERASNFSFERGRDRDNYYSRLGLTYAFEYGSD